MQSVTEVVHKLLQEDGKKPKAKHVELDVFEAFQVRNEGAILDKTFREEQGVLPSYAVT